MTAQAAAVPRDAVCSATIGRFFAGRGHWRIMVEAWAVDDLYRGRLVFQPDGVHAPEARESPPLLSGSTAEDVVSAAHELSEKRIRALLYSLM